MRKNGILDGAKDFMVQGMDTRNGDTWDISRTQLYVVLSYVVFSTI